jgi:hypothetical protein
LGSDTLVTAIGLAASVPLAAKAVVALVPPLAIGSTPVTPVVRGRPVALVRTTDEGVPRAGVTNVGELEKTSAPAVPVSSDTAAANLALVGSARNSCISGDMVINPISTSGRSSRVSSSIRVRSPSLTGSVVETADGRFRIRLSFISRLASIALGLVPSLLKVFSNAVSIRSKLSLITSSPVASLRRLPTASRVSLAIMHLPI